MNENEWRKWSERNVKSLSEWLLLNAIKNISSIVECYFIIIIFSWLMHYCHFNCDCCYCSFAFFRSFYLCLSRSSIRPFVRPSDRPTIRLFALDVPLFICFVFLCIYIIYVCAVVVVTVVVVIHFFLSLFTLSSFFLL